MISRFPANVAVAVLLGGVVALAADPSDFFLKAYQDYQAGEKLERDGRLRDAMNSYASTVAILEQIRKEDPSWQEIVVNFRMRKAQQNIERLRAMVVAEPQNLPPQRDQLPTRGFEIDIPEPAVTTRPNQRPAAKNPRAEPDISSEQIASLERQLAEYRKLHSEEKTRRERLEGEFSSVKMELEKTRTELVAVNSRLAQSEDARQNLSAERDQLKSKAGEPQDQKIEKLSSRIARLEAEKEVAQDENSRLFGKLEKAAIYIAESNKVLAATDADRRSVAAQRDKVLGRIKRLKDNDAELEAVKQENAKLQNQLATAKIEADRLAKIETENKSLSEKLTATEKKLAEAANQGGNAGFEADALREEVTLLKDRLAASRKDLAARDASVRTIMAQLDEATGELAKIRLNPEPSEEQKRLFTESQLLRQIVLRQIHQQSERTQTVADLENELKRLQVQSDTLASSLGILANPPPVLKDEENHLFGDPVVQLKEPEVEGSGFSLTVRKSADANGSPARTSGGEQALGEEARKLAEEASSLFKGGQFAEAEKKYQRIVDISPGNPFALSNLAVTQINTGKLSAARVACEKVLSLKPGEIFASVNLAKISCRQGRFDEAIALLNQVVAADPKNAVAYNYLAFAFGKKGESAKAEEAFRQSLAIDPNYATAHFNIAVMYANSEPPSLQLAKKHYEKAKSLGTDPDPVLERRLSEIQPAN